MKDSAVRMLSLSPAELVKRVAGSLEKGRPSIGYGMTETNAYGPGNNGQDYVDHPTSTGRTTPILDVEVFDAEGALDRFEASPLLTIVFAGEAHHRAARAWLERLADQSISYTDAVSFAVMDATRCGGVMSFDHDFLLAGFRLWFG